MFEGLQLFQIRNTVDNFTGNIDLPPIYKSFYENFLISRSTLRKFEYLDPRMNIKTEMLEQLYTPDEGRLLIYNFLSLNEGQSVLKMVFDKDDEIHKLNYIPIAECATDQFILLGIGQHNKDSIVLEDRFAKQRFTPKASNIIDFVNDIKMVHQDLINGIPASKFYRNLTEDFWRVKSDDNEF
ncbi:hypothetical protein DCS32_10515 [Dokdonia sp. Dokd-P16]|uniref:hypothetical protein n=1 Tax=Dokdonia sp. Dokd-P16 TaxID=2173169 RepID=UPI000D543D38|nr:hypothetical protein [Dokdonia sp. Dokd-P16]AWH74572.1 hypothetical protein DCS32_10515 [Dokdonia sp. Dokd-P16]